MSRRDSFAYCAAHALLLVGGMWSFACSAAPVVIHDTGRTLTLDDYYAPLAGADSATELSHPQVPSSVADAVLPIRTPEMTPGKVGKRAIDKPLLAQPLFLIGADELSQRWLRRHRPRLLQLNAVGMLVNAATARDLERVAAIADGLPIAPAPASDVARLLGLRHYPVLISSRWIEQ